MTSSNYLRTISSIFFLVLQWNAFISINHHRLGCSRCHGAFLRAHLLPFDRTKTILLLL